MNPNSLQPNQQMLGNNQQFTNNHEVYSNNQQIQSQMRPDNIYGNANNNYGVPASIGFQNNQPQQPNAQFLNQFQNLNFVGQQQQFMQNQNNNNFGQIQQVAFTNEPQRSNQSISHQNLQEVQLQNHQQWLAQSQGIINPQSINYHQQQQQQLCQSRQLESTHQIIGRETQNQEQQLSSRHIQMSRSAFDDGLVSELNQSRAISFNDNQANDYQNVQDELKNQEDDFCIKIYIPHQSKIMVAPADLRLLKYTNYQPSNIFNIQQCKRIMQLGESYKGEYFKRVSIDLERNNFSHFRGVRSDGNCYYRSVIYAYIEYLVMNRMSECFSDLITWITSEEQNYYSFPKTNDKLIISYKEALGMVQKLFILNDLFDKGLIFFIRNLTKNFLEDNRQKSMNGFSLEYIVVVEEDPVATTMDEYIKNILMKMDRDAQGFLLNVVPIALRINVLIINIDTSSRARECSAAYDDIKLKSNDSLNLHDKYLFVMTKDGHYDIIYSSNHLSFEIDKLKDRDYELNRLFTPNDNQFQIEAVSKVDAIMPNDEEQIKMACCGRKYGLRQLEMQIEYSCEDNGIFPIEGMQQPMACECGHQLKKEVYIQLFPEKKKLIEAKYDQLKPSNNIKKKDVEIIIKREDKQEQRKEEKKVEEVNQVCGLCKNEIKQSQIIYQLTQCKCLFHFEELFDFISHATDGEFQLKGSKQYQQISCPNKQCPMFPPFAINKIQIKEIITLQKGEEYYNKLFAEINVKKIKARCCNEEYIYEEFEKRVMDFYNETFYVVKKRRIELSMNFRINTEIISPMCICGKAINMNDIQKISGFTIKQLQEQEDVANLIMRTEFECNICLSSDHMQEFKETLKIYNDAFIADMITENTFVSYEKGKRRIKQENIEFAQQCDHGVQFGFNVFIKLCKQFKLKVPQNIESLNDDITYKLKKNCPERVNDISQLSDLKKNKAIRCSNCKQNLEEFCQNFCTLCIECSYQAKIDQKCPTCKEFLGYCIRCNTYDAEEIVAPYQSHPEISFHVTCFMQQFFQKMEFKLKLLTCQEFDLDNRKNDQIKKCGKTHTFSYKAIQKLLSLLKIQLDKSYKKAQNYRMGQYYKLISTLFAQSECMQDHSIDSCLFASKIGGNIRFVCLECVKNDKQFTDWIHQKKHISIEEFQPKRQNDIEKEELKRIYNFEQSQHKQPRSQLSIPNKIGQNYQSDQSNLKQDIRYNNEDYFAATQQDKSNYKNRLFGELPREKQNNEMNEQEKLSERNGLLKQYTNNTNHETQIGQHKRIVSNNDYDDNKNRHNTQNNDVIGQKRNEQKNAIEQLCRVQGEKDRNELSDNDDEEEKEDMHINENSKGFNRYKLGVPTLNQNNSSSNQQKDASKDIYNKKPRIPMLNTRMIQNDFSKSKVSMNKTNNNVSRTELPNKSLQQQLVQIHMCQGSKTLFEQSGKYDDLFYCCECQQKICFRCKIPIQGSYYDHTRDHSGRKK